MLIPATQVRVGMVIMHNDELHRVFHVMHVTPGNWRGMVQTKLRNLRSGNTAEHRFSSSDKVDRATLEQNEMEFLYADGETFHFMNTETYEQIGIAADVLGDDSGFLLEEAIVKVLFYKSRPVNIELPNFVELECTYTEPAVRGNTSQGATKSAELQTGASVNVPLFVETGDVLKIDTRTREYVERVKK